MASADILFYICVILLCIGGSAFFAGVETAVTSLSEARLFQLVQEGNLQATRITRLRKDKEALIGALLLGNSAVHILGSALAAGLAIKLVGEEGVFYASAIMTVVVVTFGEVLPKTYAILNSERVALAVSALLWVICRALHPFVRIVQWIDYPFLRLLGVRGSTREMSLVSALDAIRGTIELHHNEGEVEKEDKDMLGSILDLGAREVREVMVHRKAVVSVDMGQEADAIISEVIASGHSRLPLWRDEPENIVGILHVKDLLKMIRQQKIGITREMIRQCAQKPWYVPETTNLSDQLLAFRQKRKHFACVVDEYGAWQGIVTLEDILEEIVGEIDDEHDPLEIGDIVACGEEMVRVLGSVTIRDLNRAREWNLPDDKAATVAGLVLHEARVIPEVGAVFEFFGYRFVVEERSANQITRLLVEKLAVDEAFDDAQE